jgi:beta-glucanase (GH16 family)
MGLGGLSERLRGRRNLVMALVVLALILATVMGVTAALQIRGGATGFIDDFGGGRLDSGVWETGDHVLGRGALRPANVSVGEDGLRLALPAGTLQGAEINTEQPQAYGSYRIRMRVPDSPGSVTGFFLYQAPDYENEVDIEVYNDPDGKMLVTTYSGGDLEPTNTERIELPFDPTGGLHEYGFDYGPNGVVFYADGQPVEEFTSGIPKRPMELYINAWYPDWVAGGPPESDGVVRVDRVESPGPVGEKD